jgi:hypothetical protein
MSFNLLGAGDDEERSTMMISEELILSEDAH